MLVAGEKREAMSSALRVSVRTVDFHLAALRHKCGERGLLLLALKLSRKC